MRITIFGATGAIGGLVTHRALAAGHQVTAYVRRVWLGEGPAKMGVSRENVAAFLLKVAEDRVYVRRMPVVFNL